MVCIVYYLWMHLNIVKANWEQLLLTSPWSSPLGRGKIRTLVNVNISSSSMIGMGFWQTISVLLWMKCELAHNQSCFKLEDPNRAQKWAEVGVPN